MEKYRPERIEDVAQQEEVVAALKHSLQTGAHLLLERQMVLKPQKDWFKTWPKISTAIILYPFVLATLKS